MKLAVKFLRDEEVYLVAAAASERKKIAEAKAEFAKEIGEAEVKIAGYERRATELREAIATLEVASK